MVNFRWKVLSFQRIVFPHYCTHGCSKVFLLFIRTFTWPWTQVQLVSSSFHLIPIWNSNLPLEVLCRKGEKRCSHLVSRKNALCNTLVFFCRRLVPRYISWPRLLRYSGIILSEMEAAVSFWKSFWTFLNTRSMSRSFLLIWLSKCFM